MNEEKEQSESTATGLQNQPVDKRNNRPHYLFELHKKWCKWTGIEDPDILESLDYLSGDLFFEMRKLTSQACILNEETEKRIIRKLTSELNLQGNKEKLRAVATIIFDSMKTEKDSIKELIDVSWRNIVDKQKVGIDKVCIVVAKQVLNKKQDEINAQEKKSKTK